MNASTEPAGSGPSVAVPAKFAHVLFRTGDLARLVGWYETVLGAHTVMRNEYIAFLTYDDEHHRVAVVLDPRIVETAPAVERPGVEHVSFTYATLDDLISTYERLGAAGIRPYWTVNHGPTTSTYYRDPDGNQVELQVDNFPDAASLHAWFRSGAFAENPIGVDIDFDDLIARYRAGAPVPELLRRP